MRLYLIRLSVSLQMALAHVLFDPNLVVHQTPPETVETFVEDCQENTKIWMEIKGFKNREMLAEYAKNIPIYN